MLQPIVVRLKLDRVSTLSFPIKQGSEALLQVELINDGEPVWVASDSITVYGQTVDGSRECSQSDDIKVEKGVIHVRLNNEFTQEIGKIEIELELSNESGTFRTASFYLDVIKGTGSYYPR